MGPHSTEGPVDTWRFKTPWGGKALGRAMRPYGLAEGHWAL